MTPELYIAGCFGIAIIGAIWLYFRWKNSNIENSLFGNGIEDDEKD